MATLFSPITIKGVELSNRIVLPPMASNKANEQGEVTADLIKHYLKWADSGTGLIILEHTYVDPQGRVSKTQPGLYRDENIAGFQELVRILHQSGLTVGLQLNHSGSASPNEVTGQSPVGPSPIANPRRNEGIPDELTLGDINSLKTQFAEAALRAQKAGFDLVEIHSAHSYLLNQFMSPLTNKRTDGYGGALTRRIRFPLEVVDEVRSAVGRDYCVLFRLGADDRYPTGLTPEDSRMIALALVEAGVDVLDLSGGHCAGRIDTGPGYFLYLARIIKPVVNVPVLITGGINSPELANAVISENIADLVGVGRAQLRDPHWTQNAQRVLAAQ